MAATTSLASPSTALTTTSHAADSCGPGINVFEPSGVFAPPEWTGWGPGPLSVAADNSAETTSGHVYVADGISIEPYGPYGYGFVKAFAPDHTEVEFRSVRALHKRQQDYRHTERLL